jgi:hypothetical protein
MPNRVIGWFLYPWGVVARKPLFGVYIYTAQSDCIKAVVGYMYVT